MNQLQSILGGVGPTYSFVKLFQGTYETIRNNDWIVFAIYNGVLNKIKEDQVESFLYLIYRNMMESEFTLILIYLWKGSSQVNFNFSLVSFCSMGDTIISAWENYFKIKEIVPVNPLQI